MDTQEQTIMFLQSLRGAQPMIVLVFLLIRRAMTVDELQVRTGLNGDTVRDAVKGLASKGLLCMQRGERGRQTWIPAADTFFGYLFGQNRKISETGSVVVNVESEESKELLSTLTTDKRQIRRFSESESKVLSVQTLVKDQDEIKKCLDKLHELKIYGKKADKIAEDHHITVADIEAHWKVIQGQTWENPQGMLIYMLENHAPTVEPDVEQSSGSNRYLSGTWGSYMTRGNDDDQESESE